MKPNKAFLIIAAFVIALTTGCNREDDGSGVFDNQVYADAGSDKVSTVFIKTANASFERSINAAMPRPEAVDVEITYKADPSRVAMFNKAHYQDAVMLPEAHYKLTNNKATIPAGGVKSTNINIVFSDIDLLNKDFVYVLPIAMESATNVPILESGRTVYYLFKGAALINVVANIKETSLRIDWKTPEVCNNLSTLTLEALVRVNAYDKMTTVMGIEGHFLMRIGDSGYDNSQLQIATAGGNYPSANMAWNLPKGQWVHLATTFETATGAYVIYVNGVIQTSGSVRAVSSVNFGTPPAGKDPFYIGKAYDDKRWLDGEISECRIWSTIRTADQIAKNAYEVDPASEGLVAYWKFDDGSGATVKDHSVGGNHAQLNTTKPITWIPVSLPEAGK